MGAEAAAYCTDVDLELMGAEVYDCIFLREKERDRLWRRTLKP